MNRTEQKRRERKARIAAVTAVSILFGLGGLYLLFIFAPIPLFRNMRNIWIETAMTTGEHQWLATAFIPGNIINGVMAELNNPGTTEIGGKGYYKRYYKRYYKGYGKSYENNDRSVAAPSGKAK